VGLWFGLLRGQNQTINDSKAQLASVQADTSEDQERIAQISTTGRDYLGELYTRNQAVDRLLPRSVDVGQIATSYPPQLAAAGLTVVQFDPLDPTATYQPFTVQVTGQYPNITTWLAGLEGAQQLTTVGSFQMEKSAACSTSASSSSSAGSDCSSTNEYSATLELRFWTSSEDVLRPATSGTGVAAELPGLSAGPAALQ
jgi:Tfp pilus assembly protein PilO